MISKNKIKHIQSLHLKKNRDEEGVFIIEGIKLVLEFLNSNAFDVIELFATIDFIKETKNILQQKRIVFLDISDEELKKISLQSNPNKVLAIVTKKINKLNVELLNNNLTLYLDDIRDPGNLGTIIRIADWFGIKQVICSPSTTDVYNPKTLQASMGAVLRTTVVYQNFNDLLPHLANTIIYGALLNGKNIYTSTLKNGLLVIGNEANGISAQVALSITNAITIPAAVNNGSESLNAANATAIICGEFYRQLTFV